MCLGPQYEGIVGSSISSKIGTSGIKNLTWLIFQLLISQKPFNNIGLCWGINFNKHFKIPSQYSIYGFMTLAYISSFKILSFQNSKYIKIPLLMNFSFSIDFETPFPQIRQKGTTFGIPLGNLGWLWSFDFHKL